MVLAPGSLPIQRVLVTGATGYIGGRLVPELLSAGVAVRCLARSPGKLDDRPWRSEVEIVKGDVNDPQSLEGALEGIDAAYYLVHSMGGGRDFDERDRIAARHFATAAAAAGTSQVIYLGGLGSDAKNHLSPHLRSRQEVGELLAKGPVPVTELRAAMIIGSGSASFEMLRHLVEVLPAMVVPRWVGTRCQPIAVRDVLFYLLGVLGRREALGRVFEVGGPDVLTYREMMDVYARAANLRRRLIVPVPVLSPRLSSLWVGLITPLPVQLSRTLVDSLSNEVVVRDVAIDDVLPHQSLPFSQAVELAMARVKSMQVTTWWAGAEPRGPNPAEPMPTDPDWSGGTVLHDTREATSVASASQLFRVLTSLGGERGWYTADRIWALRGFVDRALGGPGMRRGRRHPEELRVGDAVDFWRVEALVPDRLLRLRAEMRVPGKAWLEWTIELASGQAAVAGPAVTYRVVQRACFQPRGLWGRLYWWALLPFHRPIFRRLLERVVAAAERQGPSRRQLTERQLMCSTKLSSWRKLRHSKTPSQWMAYSEMIESPVSQ